MCHHKFQIRLSKTKKHKFKYLILALLQIYNVAQLNLQSKSLSKVTLRIVQHCLAQDLPSCQTNCLPMIRMMMTRFRPIDLLCKTCCITISSYTKNSNKFGILVVSFQGIQRLDFTAATENSNNSLALFFLLQTFQIFLQFIGNCVHMCWYFQNSVFFSAFYIAQPLLQTHSEI